MILLNSRFKFGEEIKTAKVIDATDKNKVRINGTEFFERVEITEKDLENLNYEKVTKFGWSTNKPLSSGKYKVTYNQTDYFMTYLDQLDLFKIVVLREY
jgi:Cdc6-like AAA superfamily ATPase